MMRSWSRRRRATTIVALPLILWTCTDTLQRLVLPKAVEAFSLSSPSPSPCSSTTAGSQQQQRRRGVQWECFSSSPTEGNKQRSGFGLKSIVDQERRRRRQTAASRTFWKDWKQQEWPDSRTALLSSSINNSNNDNQNPGVRPKQQQQKRRKFMNVILTTLLSAATVVSPRPSLAATPSTSSPPATASATTRTSVAEAQPKVTDRLFFNVRISRQDGTFYVRDDEDLNDPNDQVFSGQLILELFGDVAPETVQRFKSYAIVPTTVLDGEAPLPTYARSVFSSVDAATGLIVGGKIPGLDITLVNGASALRYGSRVFPASLWLEKRATTSSSSSSSSNSPGIKLSHRGKGLLTHAILEPLPIFGITTRSDTTELDATHVVFGRIVLSDDDDKTSKNAGRAFVQRVLELPTYSVDSRPSAAETQDVNGLVTTAEATLVEEAAQAVFSAQRNFFRKTAQALGDSRLEKVYPGKLLRRVEVTQVGVL